MAEFTEEQVKDVVKAAEFITMSLDESMRADDAINIAALVGTNDLVFLPVPDGHILMIKHLSGYNDISACTRIRVGYWNGYRFNWLETQPAPLVTETVGINATLRLREGMWAIVRFEGCTAADDLYASLNGYYIKTR